MRCILLVLTLLTAFAPTASAQVREALIVFKDGFSMKGKIVQNKDFIVDPLSGQSFVIPKGSSIIYMDDDVRRIQFSPNHVQEVLPSKPGETRKDLMQIRKQDPTNRRDQILPDWVFTQFGEWNEKWERTVTVTTPRGNLELQKRIILLTPWQTYVMTMRYAMDEQFLTKEFGPEFVMGLLYKHYAAQKNMKEAERRQKIATFMEQAGWYGFALNELEKLVKEYPETKEAAEPQIDHLKRLRARLAVEEIERTHRSGQHDEAQNRIAAFFQENLGVLAGEKLQIVVQDLRLKYDLSKEKIQSAQQHLKNLPPRLPAASRPFWAVVAATIADELTIDTLPKLDTFLTFAQQHVRELDGKGKPAQATEEILALALSGWLQGNTLAEPDVKNATRLFRTRLMLQEYLKTDGSAARIRLASTNARENDLPVDVVARIIRNMPPITPFDAIVTNKQIKLDIEVADASGGTYLVQLPPDYNHNRSYPVVMMLQSPRDKASEMIDRSKELAAMHGYILVAPLWGGKGFQFSYKYSAKEHALVLDCLRDLRRRFNIDSDRVFLFGWEDGGTMAFDVGLAHPDQFAGVVPMNGSCAKFSTKCWSNGQYLPFYVIEGDNNGNNPKTTRALFKEWIRAHYPSIYVEYKGRASEWFTMELPTMFDWMNRKKRHLPARELGRFHAVAGAGEEFKTLRAGDNKFYWVGTDSIDDRNTTDAVNFQPITRPASLQAIIAVGNEADAKGAKIWNQINVRTTGVKNVSIWLAPHMIDFTKPVVVRVNNAQYGKQRLLTPSLETMLEEFYQSGDRHRLFYAKIELKL